MKVSGHPTRTIWPSADGLAVEIIDQTQLPPVFVTARLATLDEAAHAIRASLVRWAPLIGATAAWGLWLALRADPSDAALTQAHATLLATRPTAVNLRWALDRVRAPVAPLVPSYRADATRQLAIGICDEDVALNRAIGAAALQPPPGSDPLENRVSFQELCLSIINLEARADKNPQQNGWVGSDGRP